MKTFLIGATLALGLVAAAAAAAAAPGGADKTADGKLYLPLEGQHRPAVMNAPPSNDQMEREYPRIAQAMNIAGEATVTCTVEIDGRLDACRVDEENPAGMGFGAAVLRLSAYFTFTPNTFDGKAVIGKVTVPIRFKMGAETSTPPPAETIPPPTSPAALVLAREVVTLGGEAHRLKALESWMTDQMTQQVVANGEVGAGERVADAYRLGVHDAVAEEAETRARLMAATMTANQLSATLAYLNSPAGAAYREAESRLDDIKRQDLWRKVYAAAKVHLCDLGGCSGSEPASSR